MTHRLARILAPSLLILTLPTLAMAQTESAAAQETSIHGGVLVLASYIVLWVLVFAFVFYVLRTQRRVHDELDGLERRIERLFGDEERA